MLSKTRGRLYKEEIFASRGGLELRPCGNSRRPLAHGTTSKEDFVDL